MNHLIKYKKSVKNLSTKKLFLLIMLSLFLTSCREMANAFNQKYYFQKGILLKFNDDEKKTLTVYINGKPYNLYFDTGFSAAVTVDENKFPLDPKKILRKRQVSAFDNKNKVSTVYYISDSIVSNLFRLQNVPIYITGNSKKGCFDNKQYEGLVNVLTESDFPLELNYQKGYIQLLDSNVKIPAGYQEIESKFNKLNSVFSVKLNVNGISDFFLFDTGNNGPILLNKEVYKLNKVLNKVSYIGSGVGGVSITMHLNIYDAAFKLGEYDFINYVGMDESSKRSIINFNLIKKFNWIIDRKNKKVYYKVIDENKLNIPYEKNHLVHAVYSENGKLKVSYATMDSEYKINEVIESVSGNKITTENICKYQKLLNETKDWAKLEIKTTKKDSIP